MSAYRFCRTDDIALLADALNRCRAPHFPNEPPATPTSFKRAIRDLQVWCSSCMVALSGSDPIAVLIGAKRSSATLVYRIAVHPDHLRQGHGRHLLTSLASKLAILGPPRLVAEVPETLTPACALFRACGYVHEAVLTDYIWHHGGPHVSSAGLGREDGHSGAFVIPVRVDDLAANGLLADGPPVCWERSVETLTARKDEIAGFAIAADERLEASVLYVNQEPGVEILSLRSFIDDGGARLMKLLLQLRATGVAEMRVQKVHPAENASGLLQTLGFRSAGRHRLYTATARP